MNWLGRIFGKSPQLSISQQATLDAFQNLPGCDKNTRLTAQRFVVVDVESTGLNLSRDQLISIGAVTVVDCVLQLGRCFEVVLQQHQPSSVDNILIHGIDGTTQTTGKDPVDGLLDFLAFAGNAPLIAYHAGFDRTMINRATKKFLGMAIANPWIDLAFIAPALYPELAPGRHALDDWTSVFNIENLNRHNAVADACATAQLFLVMLARAWSTGFITLRDLIETDKAQRWLTR